MSKDVDIQGKIIQIDDNTFAVYGFFLSVKERFQYRYFNLARFKSGQFVCNFKPPAKLKS